MNIDELVAEKMRECGCSFSIEKRTLCKPSILSSILQGSFHIFIENGTEPGAPVRILDEEQQKYYSGTLTRFDEYGLDFEIIDLEGKDNAHGFTSH